jgi:hypothetical protein
MTNGRTGTKSNPGLSRILVEGDESTSKNVELI